MALSKLLFEFFIKCRCCRSVEPAPQYRDVRYNEIYQMMISKHLSFFILYSIVYFVLSQKTRFTVICFHCFRWQFAIVTTVQQKDQAKQIEELVPKRGPTSVAWAWFSYEKCDMEEKTAQIIQENGPHHHLRENHIKEYRESLWIRGKYEPGPHNKPQTQTLEQAFPCGTRCNKDSQKNNHGYYKLHL